MTQYCDRYKVETYQPKCQLKNRCETKDCGVFCARCYVFNYLLENSNIGKTYINGVKMKPDKVDLESFRRLKLIKENILEWASSGQNLCIMSTVCGNGKAQPLYSKIFTENGYVNLGDLKIGDKIYGEDGELHNVTGIFDRGIKPIYEVTFSDGTSTRCCDEHLWTYKYDKTSNYITEPLRDLVNKKSPKFIPITKPLNMKKKNLEIDPYVLGALIGDGGFTNTNISFSNTEIDIVNKLKAKLSDEINFVKVDDVSHRLVDKSDMENNGEYRVNRLNEKLRHYNLFNKKSSEKFIPNDYKYSSIEDRLEILRGLIDTDGYVTNEGGYVEYSTTSQQLSEDIKFIVQSLGGTCYVGTKLGKYTHRNRIHECKTSYRLGIKLPLEYIPFSSSKHLSRYTGRRQREPYRKIVNVKFIGDEVCKCIMVDNPSHLYLTDNLIVTHNTTWATKLMLNYFAEASKKGFGVDGLFISVSDLLAQYKNSIGTNDTEILNIEKRLIEANLVVFDDIGTAVYSNFDIEKLFKILNERTNAGLANIFTTNMTSDVLKENMGNRLYSRVVEKSEKIVFRGRDRRGAVDLWLPTGGR